MAAVPPVSSGNFQAAAQPATAAAAQGSTAKEKARPIRSVAAAAAGLSRLSLDSDALLAKLLQSDADEEAAGLLMETERRLATRLLVQGGMRCIQPMQPANVHPSVAAAGCAAAASVSEKQNQAAAAAGIERVAAAASVSEKQNLATTAIGLEQAAIAAPVQDSIANAQAQPTGSAAAAPTAASQLNPFLLLAKLFQSIQPENDELIAKLLQSKLFKDAEWAKEYLAILNDLQVLKAFAEWRVEKLKDSLKWPRPNSYKDLVARDIAELNNLLGYYTAKIMEFEKRTDLSRLIREKTEARLETFFMLNKEKRNEKKVEAEVETNINTAAASVTDAATAGSSPSESLDTGLRATDNGSKETIDIQFSAKIRGTYDMAMLRKHTFFQAIASQKFKEKQDGLLEFPTLQVQHTSFKAFIALVIERKSLYQAITPAMLQNPDLFEELSAVISYLHLDQVEGLELIENIKQSLPLLITLGKTQAIMNAYGKRSGKEPFCVTIAKDLLLKSKMFVTDFEAEQHFATLEYLQMRIKYTEWQLAGINALCAPRAVSDTHRKMIDASSSLGIKQELKNSIELDRAEIKSLRNETDSQPLPMKRQVLLSRHTYDVNPFIRAAARQAKMNLGIL